MFFFGDAHLLTLARTSFFTKRERTWGGGCHRTRHLAPECDKASRQIPTESLGRSESDDL